MTVLSPASWCEFGSYDARNDRLHVSSLLSSLGATLTTSFSVSAQIVPSMVLTVGSGSAYIDNTYASVQGAYCFVNDAPITVTVQPADATYPRIDRVVARVYDAQYAGTETKAQIEIVKGDPAVSPGVPALPANSIELARISVAANTTTITSGNIDNSVMPVAGVRSALISQGLNAAWTSYTPTFSNFTAGTSSIVSRYNKVGRMVNYSGIVTLASGFSMSASPLTISLPVALSGVHSSNVMSLGTSILNDASVLPLMAMAVPVTSTTFGLKLYSGASVTSTAPFTWVTTDSFSWNIMYESAT